MESQEVMEGDRMLDAYVSVSTGDAFEQMGIGETRSENLGDELLVDLDSYLDDINDRLTISRLVNDSVIKGMVTAVEQEAANNIAAKEFEVATLKELLKLKILNFDKPESFGSPLKHSEPVSVESGRVTTFKLEWLQQDEMRETLQGLRNVVSLGGVLQEKDLESWAHVDRTLYEWQCEKDLQEELEDMVLQSSIQAIMEEFEQRLWSENACSSDCQRFYLKEKFGQISNIRMELDAILKSFSHSETGQLASHGSLDTDNVHRRGLSNSITSLSLWNENGKLDGSGTNEPENYEAAQLKHLSKEELVGHFNSIITKMRRDHESTVHQLTEEFFCLKREYLKEKGSSLPHKKDKDLDALKKAIAEVIRKLDDILMENEKPPSCVINSLGFNSLKDRLDSLVSENDQLRQSLMAKKEEVKYLTTQLAVDAELKLQHPLIEVNMLNMVGDLNSDLVDAHIETAIVQDIYKCTLRDMIQDVNCDCEESDLHLLLMQEIYDVILNGGVVNSEMESTFGIEGSDVEQLILQGIYEVVFRETLKDAGQKLKQLYGEYLVETENRVGLTKTLEDKEKILIDISTTLAKEREQLEITVQELYKSREDANEQQILVHQSNKDLQVVKGTLDEALLQIAEAKVNIHTLNEKHEKTLQDLEDANEQRKMADALCQEKQTSLLLAESKENELRKQMEAVITEVQGTFKIFDDSECKVAGKIKAISLRFEDSLSQLRPLLKKAKSLKKTGRVYQQRLERRCADLQKAEAEVDLLGDEVDKLLSLLEKIYISLNHYSPVLQHYPGVVEILKLIRRELIGESMKGTESSPC